MGLQRCRPLHQLARMLLAILLTIALLPATAFADTELSKMNIGQDAVEEGQGNVSDINGDDSSSSAGEGNSEREAKETSDDLLQSEGLETEGKMSLLAYTGTGLNDDPIIISTAQDFVSFVQDYNYSAIFPDKENLYIELGDDIDLDGIDWEPLGTIVRDPDPDSPVWVPFESHFDGKGFTVSNLTITEAYAGKDGEYYPYGLFGVMSSGEIKNVNLESAQISLTNNNLGYFSGGVMVGLIYPEENATITLEGCTVNNSTVAVQGGTAAFSAGLVGVVHSGASTNAAVTLRNNTVNAALTTSEVVGQNFAGGLIAYVAAQKEGIDVVVEGCTSSGSASAKQTANSDTVFNSVGGLIGQADVLNGAQITIHGCSSTTTVKSQGNISENTAGGLIGRSTVSGSVFTLNLCSYSGNVETIGSSTYNDAAGTIGNLHVVSNTPTTEPNVVISVVTTSGSISSTGSGVSNNAGGLIAQIETVDYARVLVEKSGSWMTALASGAADYNEAGGLFGYIYARGGTSFTVSHSFATENATARDGNEAYAGGLVGSVSSEEDATIMVSNTYALGDASASGGASYNTSGGLVGYVGAGNAAKPNGTVLIEKSYAVGKVEAIGASSMGNQAGGLVGSADAFGGAVVTVDGSVALGEIVQAHGSSDNQAARFLGSIGPDSSGTVLLLNNYAWRGVEVNGAKVGDSDNNATGIKGPILLMSEFWLSSQSGPGFDSIQTWNVANGRLPELHGMEGATRTPQYLAADTDPDPDPDPDPGPDPDPAPDPVTKASPLAKTGDRAAAPAVILFVAVICSFAMTVSGRRKLK